MKRLPPIALPAALRRLSLTGALVLATAFSPASAAGERAAGAALAASPYRLSGDASAQVQAASAAPYLADTRYRLALPAATEAAAAAADAAAALARKPYAREIDVAARASGVDPALVHALVQVESAYRPHAVSAKGAVGLMQLLPETAARYGVADVAAVGENLRAGTRHLRRLLERYDDRLDLVLAAYNAGEGAVSRYGNRIPPYAETQLYVPAVLANYRPASLPPVRAVDAPAKAVDYLPGTRLDTLALARLR